MDRRYLELAEDEFGFRVLESVDKFRAIAISPGRCAIQSAPR